MHFFSVILSPVPYYLGSVPLHHCHFLWSFVDVHMRLPLHFRLCNLICVSLPILSLLYCPCTFTYSPIPLLLNHYPCGLCRVYLISSPAHHLFLMWHTLCPYQRTFEFLSFCSNPCTFASMPLPSLCCPYAGALVFFLCPLCLYLFTLIPTLELPFSQRTFPVPLSPYTRPSSLLYAIVNVLLNYFPCSLPLVLFPICPFSLYPFVFSYVLLTFSQFPCTLCSSSPVRLRLILRY